MFRHQGKTRTFFHNLLLASLLSFIAGMVNICGVLALQVLTTNVTGHFAFFSENLVLNRFTSALAFLVYILFFLLGAFASNFMMELTLRKKPKWAHTWPMVLEVLLLLTIAWMGKSLTITVMACILLFAMGLQNALVTKISQATVRTTHLTGLFTDLGIELSQLFFYRQPADRQQLQRSIGLRLTIISFFFIGGIMGGYLYYLLALQTLAVAALFLLVALWTDTIRYRFRFYKRRWQSHHSNE